MPNSLYKSSAVFSLNPSISIHDFCAKWSRVATIAGAHFSGLVQYKNAPSSLTGAPQAGQTSGLFISLDSGVSSASPVISGITSLLLLINTLLFIFIPFFWISEKLFNVALFTVTPINSTGSNTARGLSFLVLDTCHITSLNNVVTSSASNLYASAHLGNFSVKPNSSRRLSLFTFSTAPSIKKSRF